MTKQQKIEILAEFKESKELTAFAEKRLKELKDIIKAEIETGKYGDLVLTIEEREVKEYVVPARTDKIIKVSKI